MINILVAGANGQLGLTIESLKENYLNYNFFFAIKSKLNITNKLDIDNFVQENKIDVIINCAAYTKVDEAESEYELADEINHLAVEKIAKIAKKHKIKLIHISTDYVFEGKINRGLVESDKTNPKNVYGATKLNGEIALQKINPDNSIIIRTSWVFSKFGKNFVKTILRLSSENQKINIVSDQFGSPTNAKDLAKAILDIIPSLSNNKVQIYHYANVGSCSWFQFAQEIVKGSSNNCKVMPIFAKEFKVKAKRPNYSILNSEKIQKKFNLKIPNWKDSLNESICELERK